LTETLTTIEKGSEKKAPNGDGGHHGEGNPCLSWEISDASYQGVK
jgi:hypothetical protein